MTSQKTDKIRALFILPALLRGGAETQTIDLVNSIDSKKIKKYLLVFEKELDQLDRVDKDSVEFYHFERTRKFDFSFIRKVSKLIDDQKIDVVHCTLQISLLVGWLAVRLSKRKPKMIVAIHTTINVIKKNEFIDRYLYRLLMISCDKVIFVCKTQADYWGGKFPELRAKSVVVYNGVDAEYFRPEPFEQKAIKLRQSLSIPNDSSVITCIAGFRKEKAHDILFKAFSQLKGAPHLILAGDGLLRQEMENYASELDISERVHFLGNVSDVRPVLAASDVSVLASTAVETFSIAMLESMSMEVAFIATDIGGLREAIQPGETGDVVEVGSIDALRSSLDKYLVDKSRLKQMGVLSRLKVQELFSKDEMVRNTELVLSSLANV